MSDISLNLIIFSDWLIIGIRIGPIIALSVENQNWLKFLHFPIITD